MTREEAIRIIEKEIHIDVRCCTHEDACRFEDALRMAITALRERDALLAEIKDMCFLCSHWNNGSGDKLCESCDDEDNFEWRGPQEDV